MRSPCACHRSLLNVWPDAKRIDRAIARELNEALGGSIPVVDAFENYVRSSGPRCGFYPRFPLRPRDGHVCRMYSIRPTRIDLTIAGAVAGTPILGVVNMTRWQVTPQAGQTDAQVAAALAAHLDTLDLPTTHTVNGATVEVRPSITGALLTCESKSTAYCTATEVSTAKYECRAALVATTYDVLVAAVRLDDVTIDTAADIGILLEMHFGGGNLKHLNRARAVCTGISTTQDLSNFVNESIELRYAYGIDIEATVERCRPIDPITSVEATAELSGEDFEVSPP